MKAEIFAIFATIRSNCAPIHDCDLQQALSTLAGMGRHGHFVEAAPIQLEVAVNASGQSTPRPSLFSPLVSILLALTVATIPANPQGGSQTITLPLSPTSLNVFNFGIHSFKVQYPPGTKFSGVNMTITAVQLSQPNFHDRVAETQFARSLCVVYSGEADNCIDYKVTCSNSAHQPIACPRTMSSYISVETSFNTTQTVTNPGFLDAPIGTNSWTNILDQYFMMRIDPTAHGHTNGFSEFVVVGLGATNPQGPGKLTFNAPLRNQDLRLFPVGTAIRVSFILASTVHSEQVTDAVAGLSVLRVAGPTGQPTSVVTFTRQNAFAFTKDNDSYNFTLPSQTFPAGTYILTVYGNAFASTAISFTIH